MNAHSFTNRLIKETSPYLLQHAHNPVDWWPWSDGIFEVAKVQNKPILLSIGYAACHWCHVMERESFEDVEVAEFMNEHFLNVKVDREERPDVDHIYMDALQAMTGSGGWPLNIFLLPDGKPFYGGTYFPPKASPQRASWMGVLKAIKDAYENNKPKLIEQASNLTNHLLNANITAALHLMTNEKEQTVALKEEVELIAERILQQSDTEWGGFGNAPKFPQTFSIQFLLRAYHTSGNENALQQALLSLDRMIQGGIYDHLAGGFSRYSTDRYWQAPHFEKMLYDNALLLTVLSEAFQITGFKRYQQVIEQTLQFLNTELSNGEGAYFAALDADSEGVEGKFYTWTYEEIKALLEPSVFYSFCDYYQIKPEGNWEHRNILWTLQNFDLGIEDPFLSAKNILMNARLKKIRPSLDDKMILSWNNLLVIAFCKSYAALGNETFRTHALKTMQWIENNLIDELDTQYFHSVAKGVKKTTAFLEDYATLITAYIHLQEITGNVDFLIKAKRWTEFVLAHFIDDENVFFYFTGKEQIDVILRKKENHDGAQPSGNAMMSYALFYLGTIFEVPEWVEQSSQMIRSMRKLILQYPLSFGYWSQVFYLHAVGFTELVAVGPTVQNNISCLSKPFMPEKLPLFIPYPDPRFSRTKGKKSVENQYFICKNNTCSVPIKNVSEFLALI